MIDWNIVVSLLSFIVSAASVFVAYLAIRESKKTTQGTLISNSRQDWINHLRRELIKILEIIDYLPSSYANKSISTDDAIKIEHRFLIEKIQTVKLLINFTENKHRNLVRYITYAERLIVNWINYYDIILYANDRFNNMNLHAHQDDTLVYINKMQNNFNKVKKRIVKLSQDIFKEEWERVKKGK